MFLHWKGLPQIRFRSSERLRRFKQQILVRSSKGKVTKNSIKRHWRFLTRWKTQSIIYRSENLEAAKTAEDQSITLVKERQKLILLADKSQRRWKTVQEYVQHELAEKKIYPAEARASKNPKRPAFHRNPASTRLVQGIDIWAGCQTFWFTEVTSEGLPRIWAYGKIDHWMIQQATMAPGQSKHWLTYRQRWSRWSQFRSLRCMFSCDVLVF